MANWLHANWKYRTPVTVDNSSNTANLSYYQTSITLSGSNYTAFAARAKADGSDLRVTDSDGTTVLSHWLEGIDATNSQVFILVKVPAVASGATRTIYLYYGNPAASSVSSATTAVGPTVTATGPTDIYNQSDAVPGYCNATILRRLRNQAGGNASHNGDVLAILGVGAQGDQMSGSEIALLRSTDGGLTWSKSIILAPPSTANSAVPRAFGELSDGSLVLVYSYDTSTKMLAGQGKIFVAKSTDAGSTWTNLSTSATNQLAVPWTVGTDVGTAYTKVTQDSTGRVIFTAYGKPTGAARFSVWLLRCPLASDQTNGSNWSNVGTIFNGVSDARDYNECDILSTGGTGWVAITRTGAGDLYRATSSDDGVTWGAAAAVGMPQLVPSGTSLPVSPALLRLASGNVLLAFGARQGTTFWGVCQAISTDGGATFLDRPPCGLQLKAAAGNSSDWGYPGVEQLADGTVLVSGYYYAGTAFLTNAEIIRATEDYLVNCNNQYFDCESTAGWTAGAQATASSTQKHSGTNSLKLDNSAGINPYAYRTAWPTKTAQLPYRIAFTGWRYETQVGTAANTMGVLDSAASGAGTATASRRLHTGVWSTPFDVEWFNGSTWTDTGVATALNRWNKHTLKASLTPGAATATGQYLLNNASVTTSVGGYSGGSTGAPQVAHFLACSATTTHSNTMYVDDVYTHQYTPTTPTVSAGTEASGGGFVIRTRSAMSGGFGGK